jgi:hypothetical protein
MAQHPALPARGTSRGHSTHQGTAAAAANEPGPTPSESISSSPSPSRLSDTADLRTTAPHMMNRLPSPSHAHSLHSVPESAALSTPRRSPSSSIPRAHDMDHHHHHHHQHGQGQGSRPTTLQRVATGLRRLTRASDIPVVSEEDWSVFGEAMAHEGVQPQPQPSAPPGVVPTSRVLASSPLSDSHLEDFIPSVEGGVREVRGDEEGRSSLDTGLLASSSSRSHSLVNSSPSDTESTSLVSPDTDPDQQGQNLRGGKGRSSWWKRLSHLPKLPTLYRNILKCSIAYFLGSLFTYYAPLSRFISELTQDGPAEKYPSAMGHMVATV